MRPLSWLAAHPSTSLTGQHPSFLVLHEARKKMEPRIKERIAQDFPADAQASVMELLRGYSGPEIERVMWDVLVLSKGSVESVKTYVDSARTDYRDVLYWAEYYDTDPLIRDHDPKKLAQEIINKWGVKN